VANKVKKAVGDLGVRFKKLSSDLNKVKKEVKTLSARVNKSVKRKRKAGSSKAPKAEIPIPQVKPPVSFQRHPTPIVNPDAQWFHIPESPRLSAVSRTVSPTPPPQYMNPIYASRNFIR